jgi:hypothetical protein
MRAFLIAMALVLGGCTTHSSNSLQYTRTDGRPADPAQQQAVLAQCTGGTASAVDACMARNGYIHAQQ